MPHHCVRPLSMALQYASMTSKMRFARITRVVAVQMHPANRRFGIVVTVLQDVAGVHHVDDPLPLAARFVQSLRQFARALILKLVARMRRYAVHDNDRDAFAF